MGSSTHEIRTHGFARSVPLDTNPPRQLWFGLLGYFLPFDSQSVDRERRGASALSALGKLCAPVLQLAGNGGWLTVNGQCSAMGANTLHAEPEAQPDFDAVQVELDCRNVGHRDVHVP